MISQNLLTMTSDECITNNKCVIATAQTTPKSLLRVVSFSRSIASSGEMDR